jgi:hypothetical protein
LDSFRRTGQAFALFLLPRLKKSYEFRPDLQIFTMLCAHTRRPGNLFPLLQIEKIALLRGSRAREKRQPGKAS